MGDYDWLRIRNADKIAAWIGGLILFAIFSAGLFGVLGLWWLFQHVHVSFR
jgi:hypothetical protein